MLRDPMQGWIHVGGSFGKHVLHCILAPTSSLLLRYQLRFCLYYVTSHTAINEGDYYDPGSFHIDYGTHAMMSETSSENLSLVSRRGARKRDWFRAERGRLAGENGWINHDHDAIATFMNEHEHNITSDKHKEHAHGLASDWNGQYPTGEFCG